MRYLLFVCLSLLPFGLYAKFDVTPPCFKTLESSFFDPGLVRTALGLYNVPQGSWQAIIDELQKRERTMHKMVWEMAAKQKPNPLDTHYDQNAAAAILKTILYREFHVVLVKYNVYAEADIEAMFNYIEQQQSAKINACFGRPTFHELAK